MITLNTLMREAGLEPKTVKLVRHRDRRFSITPYQLWIVGDGSLERYQTYQARTVFANADYVASFVATPLNETLFVGMFAVREVGTAIAGEIDPLSGNDMNGLFKYDLEAVEPLVDYRGKLVIDWGLGFRSWVQRAGNQDKPIVEIRRQVSDPPFPGFLDFTEQLTRLVTVPLTWRTALSSVSGVYLLVCPDTGRQYVGAAYGEGGFWSRWEAYVRSGHGGNVRMRELPPADYHVSVLEVSPSSASLEDVMQTEARWKRKLRSREFGLNAN
jgi:hypothetical protein